MVKTLIILRHAKAEAASSGRQDHARGLMHKGEEAARSMGDFMREEDFLPDHVLCSTAARARQTLEWWQKGSQHSPHTEFVEKLYLASPAEIWHRVHETVDSVKTLMVVGHNPGLHLFCAEAVNVGEEADLHRLAMKFPTAAMAALRFPVMGWRQVQPGGATLLRFVTPKQLMAGFEDHD